MAAAGPAPLDLINMRRGPIQYFGNIRIGSYEDARVVWNGLTSLWKAFMKPFVSYRLHAWAADNAIRQSYTTPRNPIQQPAM